MHFRTPAIVLAALLAQSALATDCPAGSYWKPKPMRPSEYTCTPCSAGYISKAKNVYACEPCPAGQEDTNGHQQCTNCPAGEYSTGGEACKSCPDGTISSSGASTCTNCPAGQESKFDHKSCQNCDAGEYSTGGTQCKPCLDGTISGTGASTCTNCPAGQESKSDHKSCQKCDPGEFNPTAGEMCQKCPAGKFTSVSGAKSCCDCCSGYYSTSSGSTSCKACRDLTGPGTPKPYGPVGASSTMQCKSTKGSTLTDYMTSCNQSANNACPVTTPGGPQGSPITRKKRDSQCSKGFTSCPRYSGRGGVDCVDTENDPEACGGCVGLDGSGSGKDCTAIQGTSATRCVKGSCVIDSCRKGWVKSLDGTECVLASRATGSPASDVLHAQDAKKAKRSSAKRAIRHNIF